jgi:hypothetical protein
LWASPRPANPAPTITIRWWSAVGTPATYQRAGAWETAEVHTVGVDLAAQPVNTGLCRIDWDAGVVVSVVGGATDDAIVEAICDPDVDRVGIDAPLGWPDAFVDAVVAHHGGAPWPGAGADPDDDRRRLRLRHTDVVVATTTGRQPMSVSADRIAVAAMRAALLQHLVRQQLGDTAVDRSGTTGVVAEVYPAGALTVWGLVASGYKGSGGADRRVAILAELEARSGVAVTDERRQAMVASDHLLDAFICALIARSIVDGAAPGPSAGEVDVARREGWIYVPESDWPTVRPGR